MHIDWTHFAPWPALAGGIAIGLAAAIMILFNGRIAGISGIVGGLLRAAPGERGWRAAFIAGLVAAPLLASLWGWRMALHIDAGWPAVIAAGFLVGLGTRYAGGCTSGHGVCGISRGAWRSIVATATFMAAGFATVFVLRHVLGG
ncbi:YeeE/YedE family protein [Herbaspirillum sp. LeCh32-8]|uniref:YeeE/YedE family protein n=1 Tax=Herbaspirillum sp. LeCh32-8 TaxID=2821356 RepID=UPI001AE2F8BD|nr:YeeE/YedE family protein [Herbaspirillum sp. LeCh32-8]MBP0598717.1 YeeE/YedE family protein [Herbaspirillum sp. LeCh32-8]